MKTCPYCKEEVNDQALKCRYCQSTLAAPEASQADTGDNRQVTYILDRDLVRFGKFAGAVLGIFLVVGASLFGFRVETALENLRTTQGDLNEMQLGFLKAQSDLEAAQETVASLKSEVEGLLASANKSVVDITITRDRANELLSSIMLTPDQQAAAEQARNTQPQLARANGRGKFWTRGATIRIRFLDGTDQQAGIVRQAVNEWAKYANLKFSFVTSGSAEIRVSFEQPGSWSYQGTDALGIPDNQATMNFEAPVLAEVLHEFGHAIGLIHENLNPRARIAWNKEAVYRDMMGPPNNWPREHVDREIFGPIYTEEQLGPYRDFDASSIMMYPLPAAWTNGTVLGGAKELSDSDKALVARLYPR